MSESVQIGGQRSWRRLSRTSLAIAAIAGGVAAIAATPTSQAEGSRSIAASPSHKPVVARSICDSDAATRARTQTVLSNRGDRPGVTVVFSLTDARPHSRWHYEVSVASNSGDADVAIGAGGSILANRQGQWSVTMVNSNEGRYSAKSVIASRSGHQHCSLRVTAAP
jgi:hypothetical protein